MVREVTLTDREQTGNGGHQLIVDPNTTHCIVDSRENHHRIIVLHTVNFIGNFTRINIGNLFIHIEKVAITLKNGINAEAIDRLREVEEYG